MTCQRSRFSNEFAPAVRELDIVDLDTARQITPQCEYLRPNCRHVLAGQP